MGVRFVLVHVIWRHDGPPPRGLLFRPWTGVFGKNRLNFIRYSQPHLDPKLFHFKNVLKTPVFSRKSWFLFPKTRVLCNTLGFRGRQNTRFSIIIIITDPKLDFSPYKFHFVGVPTQNPKTLEAMIYFCFMHRIKSLLSRNWPSWWWLQLLETGFVGKCVPFEPIEKRKIPILNKNTFSSKDAADCNATACQCANTQATESRLRVSHGSRPGLYKKG